MAAITVVPGLGEDNARCLRGGLRDRNDNTPHRAHADDPGLSIIIDAIKESRKIFQRMNSYAIYRIAETLRVLLFMTLSILILNFYPVTAVMIVWVLAQPFIASSAVSSAVLS